ncbi:MAG: PAS domain-containing sensor histidine kinase [Melioribacteraceae bacterium]|nr:PAS domain-containing sensor histidine kinase [Melioribacteraceae bacterium]
MNEFSSHEIKIVKSEFAKHLANDTDSELLNKTEKFFERILKNNNAIKLLIDVESSRVVNSNKSAQLFYGYSEDELHQKEIYDLNVLKEDEVKAEHQRSQKLGRDYFESRQKNSKGETKSVMVRSTSLKIKRKDYIYLIIHEMPEDKKIEEKAKKKELPVYSLISESNDNVLEEDLSFLEQNAKDLVYLSNKLAESEKKLQQLNANKDRFFSIISHDLKNSFFSVMGLSKILADPENNDSEDKKIETAQMLHNSSKNLYAFLENLLSWARVQRGEIDFEPEEHQLYDIVAEVTYLFNPKAKQSGIKLINKIGNDKVVYCDQNMVKTILRNFVSNALNFTKEFGQVVIDAKVDNEKVTLSVADTGVGISKENAEKLFRIDEKHIETNVNGERGTGLGLILCKEFIEKHKGDVWIESEIGKGSKFYFTLPLKKNSSTSSEHRTSANSVHSKD